MRAGELPCGDGISISGTTNCGNCGYEGLGKKIVSCGSRS